MNPQTLTPRQNRILALRAAITRLQDELIMLEHAEAPIPARGRRGQRQPCGTEKAYQQHAHYGDTANDKRRVTCDPCLKAHAEHEATQAAIRRHMARQDELDRAQEAS